MYNLNHQKISTLPTLELEVSLRVVGEFEIVIVLTSNKLRCDPSVNKNPKENRCKLKPFGDTSACTWSLMRKPLAVDNVSLRKYFYR